MRWVHVLVDIVVKIVERVVALVPVHLNGVGLGHVGWLESAGNQRHELAENADAAVPEGRLRQPSSKSPPAGGRVVGLHHVRQLKRVVVTTRHVQLTAQDRHAASNVDLGEKPDREVFIWCLNRKGIKSSGQAVLLHLRSYCNLIKISKFYIFYLYYTLSDIIQPF